MIAVDTNLLVYAHRRDSAFHEKARKSISALAEGSAPWAIAWPCAHEFFAIATHPRIYKPASTIDQAIAQIDAWLQSPTLVLLAESETHWSVLREMLLHGDITGPAVHDARIAALCRQHRVSQLWTADRDFSRFADLKTVNPLGP